MCASNIPLGDAPAKLMLIQASEQEEDYEKLPTLLKAAKILMNLQAMQVTVQTEGPPEISLLRLLDLHMYTCLILN